MPPNRFVFIACYYNMHQYLPEMLCSIGAQSYKNWKLVITDDMSDEKSTIEARAQINAFRSLVDDSSDGAMCHSKIEFVVNHTKKWETRNVLEMIRHSCEPNDIVCRIDADDSLCDRDALYAINSAYEAGGHDALWTAHRWHDGTKTTSYNISGPLNNENVYAAEWSTSHLKTFRASLLSGINETNFKGADCEYVRRAGDRAVYLPVLHRASRRAYLPMVTYAYRCNLEPSHFQTDDARFQKEEADFLHSRGFVA